MSSFANGSRSAALLGAFLAVAPLAGAAADPPAGGARITTVAGTGQGEPGPATGPTSAVNINQPFGLEFAPDGTLAVCGVGHGRVFRVDLKAGQVAVIAGDGRKANTGDGRLAAQASLIEPYEVRFDKAGNLYIADMIAAAVRRVDAKTGIITTVAGTGKPGFSGDGGPAVKAELRQPHSIALDIKGNLYIADIGNHRIRRVNLTTGIIETVAGNGTKALPEEGPAANKPMVGPRALCIVGDMMYIALREGHSVWRMNLADGTLSHVAGTGKAGYADGPAKSAAFNGPKGIIAGPNADLFVADTENQVIRRIDLKAGTVSTVAGAGPKARGFGGDGGPATAAEAKMDRPHGITVDAAGVLYIGDSNNHRVRRVGL